MRLDVEDDCSNVILKFDVGIFFGGLDVVYKKELGGFLIVLIEVNIKWKFKYILLMFRNL